MATFQAVPDVSSVLQSRMREAREQTDAIFRFLSPNSFYERPIPERHRLIFYLGHLEAFDWNLLSGPLGLSPHDAEFDKLFAFGIDPVGGGLPTDVPADWPQIIQVENYNRSVRDRLDERLGKLEVSQTAEDPLSNGELLQVAIEHRLMHEETLAYLLHGLAVDKLAAPAHARRDVLQESRMPPLQHSVEIPAGVATLGQRRKHGRNFGWDNEFEETRKAVPAFSIDAYPVTNGEFRNFVHAGGYENESYWSPEGWKWRSEARLEHPHYWRKRSASRPSDPSTQWGCRAMLAEIQLPLAWPVYVSHAEASAFARWAGKKLPSEAQWHRAAYGTLDGNERAYPWGGQWPDATRGNFHHERWDASPVDAHPAGKSAFGVYDLLGNGWEWTSTVFAPYAGFEPRPFYPGYSANFFDGKHYVMKGGSARTDACMLRRSFRNWFQPHYPYVYATFRCVEE
jgi:gamma-glutamyl hercynylcysteine S-oxide synthase